MKTPSRRTLPLFVAACWLTLASFALTGCKSGKEEPITPLGENTAPPAERDDSDSLPKFSAEDVFFQKVDGLNAIYFGYDSSSLDNTALTDVRAAYELLKTDPNAIVQVEGHCDERGTQDYNLALGERRAQSVRDQLRQLGISGDRIVTMSYGEEVPAESGSNESAFAKNRRCEFSRASVQ